MSFGVAQDARTALRGRQPDAQGAAFLVQVGRAWRKKTLWPRCRDGESSGWRATEEKTGYLAASPAEMDIVEAAFLVILRRGLQEKPQQEAGSYRVRRRMGAIYFKPRRIFISLLQLNTLLLHDKYIDDKVNQMSESFCSNKHFVLRSNNIVFMNIHIQKKPLVEFICTFSC